LADAGSLGARGGDGGAGGGIWAADTVDLTRTLVSGNATGDGAGGGSATGGLGGPSTGASGTGGNGGNGNAGLGGGGGPGAGLYVLGTAVSIVNTTIDGNQTGRGGDGGAGTGGKGGNAINQGGNGGNGVGRSAGGGGTGGGAFMGSSGALLRNATMTLNHLGGGGSGGSGTGGAAGTGGTSGSPGTGTNGSSGSSGFAGATFQGALTNTIVAGNDAPACGGSITDGGHDISFADASCPGANVDPKLGPLASNGGPTQTRALLAGSPAINAVPASGAGCPATDQRGVVRPNGPDCDIGAYEHAPPTVTTGAATGVSTSAATLHGQLNPNARSTHYHFEYGTTTSYGTSTATKTQAGGVSAVTVSAAVGSLTPATTYHYRLVATNADGTTRGHDRTFTTAGIAPPDTEITKAKISRKRHRASFRFTGSGGVAPLHFKCKLTHQSRRLKRWKSCSSPKTYKHLKKGTHVFKVKAVDSRGTADPTPAKKRFRIR
jgi:hypothetical protein